MAAKITIIGAGGYVFPLRLTADILSHPELQDVTIAYMDIDPERLEKNATIARDLVKHHGLPAKILSTTNRREALKDANYVIITFQVGGLEAYKLDKNIPLKYGIDQAVGDTLGPGGVFRFLRSAPAYQGIAEDMKELCPDTLLINYANPMAMACWYLSSFGIKTVGLCHSVQNTTHMLAKHLGVPYKDINFTSAGINHQAWVLEFKHRGEDLYPKLREVMRREHVQQKTTKQLQSDQGDHSELKDEFSTYEGGQERVRSSLMDMFGYFHTESSHHASEYLAYFRKNPKMVLDNIPQRWDYYDVCAAHDDKDIEKFLVQSKEELKPSLEYGSHIIHAMETNKPAVVYGNVPNTNLISNLPQGCSVEVACLVNKNGLQPTHYGALPTQLAAVNRTNVNVQELAVQAALTENVENIYHAIALDPLTSSLLTLPQIRAMVDEMLVAQEQWLPEFARSVNTKILEAAD
ncbi:MAG: alpha-glucosidase/alpha-galactosidase [Trueperaceae bacterium]